MRILFLSTATGYLRHKLDPSRDPSYVYRIHNTALAIRRLGGAADMLHLSDMRIPGRARGWDVVVIHRPAMSASLAAAMETFRRHKTLVFGDFDDLIFSPAQVADRPSVRMGEKSPHVASERAQHHLEAIRELDGVIASTPVLIDAFAGLANPPARRVLLPNSWHLTWEPLRHAARARPPALRGGAQGGVTLVGCFDDRDELRIPATHNYPRLGALGDVADFAKTHRVHQVYLSLPMASQPRIQALLDALKDTTASVYFVPDLFVTDLIQGRADSVCDLPVICVCETPFRGSAALLKRASDLVLATSILVVILPLMMALALAIRLTSPGPVIFRQRRYGLDGHEIIVYKFRSMTVLEDGPTSAQAQRGDARITRLGAFMRRTSLDELPQFINVLQGRMSVVGPRPHAVAHNELYRSQIKSYMVRHKVRPGITGWAQVHGFRGETQSLELMKARVRLDHDYLRHWSLALDLAIIARTVRLVFRDSAAF